jgi:hypothetical protein
MLLPFLLKGSTQLSFSKGKWIWSQRFCFLCHSMELFQRLSHIPIVMNGQARYLWFSSVPPADFGDAIIYPFHFFSIHNPCITHNIQNVYSIVQWQYRIDASCVGLQRKRPRSLENSLHIFAWKVLGNHNTSVTTQVDSNRISNKQNTSHCSVSSTEWRKWSGIMVL